MPSKLRTPLLGMEVLEDLSPILSREDFHRDILGRRVVHLDPICHVIVVHDTANTFLIPPEPPLLAGLVELLQGSLQTCLELQHRALKAVTAAMIPNLIEHRLRVVVEGQLEKVEGVELALFPPQALLGPQMGLPSS